MAAGRQGYSDGVFRSVRRQVVYPQAEHARLAAVLALHWGNPQFARPPLPFGSFVAGVALHDRGYGQLDADAIGEVDADRWITIQEAGFAPVDEDAVVDLVVAMHVHRLVSSTGDAARHAVAARMAEALPDLRASAGVDAPAATDADRITNLCDLVSFDFCEEDATSGSVAIAPATGAEPVPVHYAVDGHGGVTLAPWPLDVPTLGDVVIGFQSDGYPHTLAPVVTEFNLCPG
jgi:hypothetical protein